MKTLLKTTVAALLLPLCAQAYSSLQVTDPRNGGLWAGGVIDRAVVDITPQGQYAMYDLQLAISAGKIEGKDYDSLEISCNFDLPAGAVIKSASLLIDGAWTEAALMPRNEAHAIYEGTVQRRKDPLIVYKNYGDNYLFKIFPLAAGSSREMKLRYAMPAGADNGSKSLALPWDLLSTSSKTPDLVVNVAKSDDFTDPSIGGAAFTETDKGYTATVAAEAVTAKPAFTSSIAAGTVSFDYSRSKDGISYKLGFVPSQLFALNSGKKVLFIVDNDPAKCTDTAFSYTGQYDTKGNWVSDKSVQNVYTLNPVPTDTVAKYIGKMLGSLDASNSFNIVVKNGGVYTFSDQWKACTPANIAEALVAIKANCTDYKADMKELITSSATLINEDNVVPVVISDNRQFSQYQYAQAATYAAELVQAVPLNKQLHAFDISQLRQKAETAAQYYYNYSYSVLLSTVLNKYGSVAQTYSYPYTVYNTSYFAEYFPAFYENGQSRMVLFAVTSQSDKVAVYDRTIGAMPSFAYNAYMEMGKLAEGTQFKATVSFRYRGQHYDSTFTFPIGDAYNAMVEDACAVQIIDALNNSGDAYAKLEAKKLSGEMQVLSRNSALLSIDPDAVVTPCWDCPDWNDWGNFIAVPWTGGPVRNLTFTDAAISPVMATGSVSMLEKTTVTETVTSESSYIAGFKAAENNCITNSADLYNAGYDEGLKAATVSTSGTAAESAALTASPNPFASKLTVTLRDGGEAILAIYDAAGNTVLSMSFTDSITLDAKHPLFSAMKSGVYVVKVTAAGNEFSTTVVKE